MGMERVATFEALIDRASILLDRGGAPAQAEALLLIEYVRRRYQQPFSEGEIDLLVEGEHIHRRTSRTLLDAVHLKHMIKAVAEFRSSALSAAE